MRARSASIPSSRCSCAIPTSATTYFARREALASKRPRTNRVSPPPDEETSSTGPVPLAIVEDANSLQSFNQLPLANSNREVCRPRNLRRRNVTMAPEPPESQTCERLRRVWLP